MGSTTSIQRRDTFDHKEIGSITSSPLEMAQEHEDNREPFRGLSVSFEYQCNNNDNSSAYMDSDDFAFSTGIQIPKSNMSTSNSFCCLSGAALGANATLANTNICNGLIGEEILPGLDSPKSFRRMSSSSSLSRLDHASSSSQGSISTLSPCVSTDTDFLESGRNLWSLTSAFTRVESSSFLNSMDVQMAGGAAGEDRVQAVCSEENGWLFCGVYDGFNGRDAADFLAGTLYENIWSYLHLLNWRTKKVQKSNSPNEGEAITSSLDPVIGNNISSSQKINISPHYLEEELLTEHHHLQVLKCLCHALNQAESDFMYMVEQEMEDRPDLVSVGSCVLVALLYGKDLYILNLGDSRAVLATSAKQGLVEAIQLTENHTVDSETECMKLLADHPDDPSPIVGGRVKGKLKITRALGVGYLKKKNMNDALMGILRVRNLCSPPYIYTHPFTKSHRITENDQFVVLGSDGLFDFFSNDDVVQLVHFFIQNNPFGDPAKYLVEQLISRAADNAGFTTEELMRIPVGRRRKYHDDVTIIVITLGSKQQTSSASTPM